MAERKRVQNADMPPQTSEMPQEMGAMFGLLGLMQEVHETREQVRELHAGMAAVIGLLEKIVKQLEQPKVAPLPVASPVQMYPKLYSAAVSPDEKPVDEGPAAGAPGEAPSSPWRRLWTKRGRA